MRLLSMLMPMLLISVQVVTAQTTSPKAGSDASKTNRANESLHSRIDEFLTSSIKNGFSGAVLVAIDEELIIDKGFGWANKSREAPISAETLFDIGSVTKQFTAAAVLKLVEQGKLKTSDSLGLYFDNLPQDKAEITIHQLLTHTAGLVDSFGDGDFDHIPEDKFFETLFSMKLLFPPGKKHRYSNAGYSVLAKVIERASGTDYEQFLRSNLFEPAGMTETGYLLPKWDANRVAHGYPRNVMDVGSTVERYQKDQKISWNLKGNGGLISTQSDMFKWYRAISSKKVLSDKTVQRWTEPYVAEQEGGESHYAYGWAIYRSKRKTKIISHNGGNGAFFHDFIWLPKEKTVIILSCNAASRRVESIAWKIEKMIFDDTYRPEPIAKNPYYFVVDFIENHQPADSAKLVAQIRNQYSEDFQDSEVLNRIGYMTLRAGERKDWAVELFRINTQLFSSDANVWDSLGDGFRAIGQFEESAAAFRKAIELGGTESSEKLNAVLKEIR